MMVDEQMLEHTVEQRIEFSGGEADAWKAILAAYKAVGEIDGDQLLFNKDELAQAIHTLQHFVSQHYLHRLKPEFFGSWYADGR